MDENMNFYDVLEITPDATPKEVREAYLRMKSAYAKDSVALYTLMSREETDQMIDKIEDAYRILSDGDKRREYDRNHKIISVEDELVDQPRSSSSFQSIQNDKIIPLDRASVHEKPMTDDDLYNVPATDYSSTRTLTEKVSGLRPIGMPRSETNDAVTRTSPAPIFTQAPAADPELDEKISRETQWSGEFIKTVRQARNVSIEEMAEFTKITKRYVQAIEEEDFEKLPAAVYLRGFLIQIARKLRIPSEKVASAYVKRYREANPKRD